MAAKRSCCCSNEKCKSECLQLRSAHTCHYHYHYQCHYQPILRQCCGCTASYYCCCSDMLPNIFPFSFSFKSRFRCSVRYSRRVADQLQCLAAFQFNVATVSVHPSVRSFISPDAHSALFSFRLLPFKLRRLCAAVAEYRRSALKIDELHVVVVVAPIFVVLLYFICC